MKSNIKKFLLGLALVLPLYAFSISFSDNLRGDITDRNGEILAHSSINEKRVYSYGEATAHTIGYARINQGKAGLEKTYNNQLAKGETLKTSLDIHIQNDIFKLFKNQTGTAIILDITNGEILSALSFPSYNANDLARGVTQKEWDALNNNPSKPFNNKFINGLYPLKTQISAELLHLFEFGKKTGVDLPNEFHGVHPDKILPKYASYLVTPIQISKMSAAVASGALIQAHFALHVEYNNTTIDIPQTFLDNYKSNVISGIDELVGLRNNFVKSKTSWISAYFPKDNPKYAITLVLENIDRFSKINEGVRGILKIMKKYGYSNLEDLKSEPLVLRGAIKSADAKVLAHSKQIVRDGYEGVIRVSPMSDTFSPLLGYVAKKDANRHYGIKGIEKSFNKKLNRGEDVWLSMNSDLQKSIELLADRAKQKMEAKEVLIAVMETKSSKLLSLASSNRYNPQSIKQEDLASLNSSATDYLFEPGAIMMPIVLAQLLDMNKTYPDEIINAHNGHYKLGKISIKDSKAFSQMKAIECIQNNSYIVISQLAQRLSGEEFDKALRLWGFSKSSGLELLNEKLGTQTSLSLLNHNKYKALTSYGYGLHVNILQLLRAYNVFNNKGKISTLSLLLDTPIKEQEIISADTASLLLQSQKEAFKDMSKHFKMEVGGTTSVTRIAKNATYSKDVINTLFGFINDDTHKHTVGIVVIKPKREDVTSDALHSIFFELTGELNTL